ncbi:MAG: hypothetical protein ABH883_06060 [Candidatus Omnitrophota bacterium]
MTRMILVVLFIAVMFFLSRNVIADKGYLPGSPSLARIPDKSDTSYTEEDAAITEEGEYSTGYEEKEIDEMLDADTIKKENAGKEIQEEMNDETAVDEDA